MVKAFNPFRATAVCYTYTRVFFWDKLVGISVWSYLQWEKRVPTRALSRANVVTFGQVWQTLAAVLHMSNLGFDKVDNEQGEIASISDRAVSGQHQCYQK